MWKTILHIKNRLATLVIPLVSELAKIRIVDVQSPIELFHRLDSIL